MGEKGAQLVSCGHYSWKLCARTLITKMCECVFVYKCVYKLCVCVSVHCVCVNVYYVYICECSQHFSAAAQNETGTQSDNFSKRPDGQQKRRLTSEIYLYIIHI